jgi:hypothetical protein
MRVSPHARGKGSLLCRFNALPILQFRCTGSHAHVGVDGTILASGLGVARFPALLQPATLIEESGLKLDKNIDHGKQANTQIFVAETEPQSIS